MTIDEIYDELNDVEKKIYEKAHSARDKAKKARKAGDMKKWDKFNAVARAYEMVYEDINPLRCELIDYTSDERRYIDVPF